MGEVHGCGGGGEGRGGGGVIEREGNVCGSNECRLQASRRVRELKSEGWRKGMGLALSKHATRLLLHLLFRRAREGEMGERTEDGQCHGDRQFVPQSLNQRGSFPQPANWSTKT